MEFISYVVMKDNKLLESVIEEIMSVLDLMDKLDFAEYKIKIDKAIERMENAYLEGKITEDDVRGIYAMADLKIAKFIIDNDL